MTDDTLKCSRCGFCCHYWLNGKFKRCKHLVRLKNGNTLCRVYKTRLGKVIDYNPITKKNITCNPRLSIMFNYKGCPFNNPLWEDFKDETKLTEATD